MPDMLCMDTACEDNQVVGMMLVDGRAFLPFSLHSIEGCTLLLGRLIEVVGTF